MSWLAGQDPDENGNLGVDWVLKYEFGDLGTVLCMTSTSGQMTDDRRPGAGNY